MEIQVENSNFSSAPCFQTEQQRLNAFAALMFVTLPDGFSNLIISANQPTVEQQQSLWLQTDGFRNPIGFFTFSSQYAAWVFPHEIPANDPRRFLYAGAAADIDTLDGGNVNAVTDIDGPFWEIDTEFTDLIPIGAGTVPEGDNAFKFATGVAYPQVRGIYVIKRTARQFRSA